MHVHIQGSEEQLAELGTTPQAVFNTVETIVGAAGTWLVVVVYLLDSSGWAGETHHSWFRREDLHHGELPRLPDRFRLIQIAMGQNTYPYEAPDDYGWCWHFQSFLDHLAAVLEYELCHYTQPHFARYRCNE